MISSYLGTHSTARPGAQHMLNAEYFKRIDAMNFTLLHDDGHLPHDLVDADVILVGVSRTSKTPTAVYLANRGLKTANIPLVPGVPPPAVLETARKALIVGLVATPERIVQIRQNRLLSLKADDDTSYVDRDAVAEELAGGHYTHDDPITVDEAKELGLPSEVGLPDEVYDLVELFPQAGRRRPSVQFVPLPLPSERSPAKPRVP